MRTNEAYNLLKDTEEYMRPEWSMERCAFAAYDDIFECVIEGYVDGLTEDEVTYSDGKMTIKCEDGRVEYDGKTIHTVANYKRESRGFYGYGMNPYARTRAAVYAGGNKWQIENFNATH